MQEKEKARIRENFHSLISSTSCSLQFLLRFKSKGVFSLDDIKAIRGDNEKQCEMDRAYQFYRRLLECPTDPGVYWLLLNALKETKQSKPYELLTTSKKLNVKFSSPSHITPAYPNSPYKRERGRHSDLSADFLWESVKGWTCSDSSCGHINFTWLSDCVRCGESR